EAAVSAETGWWMAFEDELDIGEITPEDTVPIPNDVLIDAIGPENISYTATPDLHRDNFQSISCASGPSINCAVTTFLTGREDLAGGGEHSNNYYEVYGSYCSGL